MIENLGNQAELRAGRLSSKPLGPQEANIMSLKKWFDELRMPNQREHYSWLARIPQPHERIANFGCWSGCEPFALLWILNAHEITVVEIEDKSIAELDEQKEILSNLYPESLADRVINSVCGDMRLPIPELPDRYFDLAFCEDVLYSLEIQGGIDAVCAGIDQMIRVIKPMGLIIAVESKYQAKFETRNSNSLGIPLHIPVRISEPADMSSLFASMGLKKLDVQGQPSYSYCYQRE